MDRSNPSGAIRGSDPEAWSGRPFGENGVHASPTPDGTGGDYDALADLFLGDEARPAPSAAPVPNPTPVRPTLEGLILGHLPVLAAAWVMQYARHEADNTGAPVGVIKLRAGQASVELVGYHGEEPPALGDLGSGLSWGLARAARWLIRVDELSEARLAELGVFGTLTLLTGADEAAVVASYRTLKALLRRGEEDLPPVRLAIMGSTPERASDAGAKLARTTELHLGRRIEATACIARIGPGATTSVYRGALEGTVEEALALIRRLADGIGASAAAEPRPLVSPPTSVLRLAAPSSDGEEPDPPAAISVPVGERIRRGSEPVSGARPSPERAAPEAGRPLARHIAGLSPLTVTCPYWPQIELAVGPEGGLHLLLACAGDDGAAERAGVGQLASAASWARAHAGILRLAHAALANGHAGSGLDAGREPVLHLLTPHPARARHLLDSGVRVHFLAEVRVGDQRGWVCAELN